MGGGVCPKSVCLDGGWGAVRWLSGSSYGTETGAQAGGFLCVLRSLKYPFVPLCFSGHAGPQRKVTGSLKLDPDSLPTEEAKLLHPGMLLPSSSSTAVVSSFLMLWPVHTVPCVMLIPNHKVISVAASQL
ncbi:rCG36217, partial [Rattus norvegicus]